MTSPTAAPRRDDQSMALGATRAGLAIALVCVVTALVVTAAPARAASEPQFTADTTRIGVINLAFYGAEGAPVKFFERVGEHFEPLGTVRAAPGAFTLLKDATTWSCDRLVRHFAAMATLPDGRPLSRTFSVRTVSCAQRFEMRAPRRVAPGATARIRVVDRWKIGAIRPRLCITAPHARRACRTVGFAPAVSIASRSFRAVTPGRWRVTLAVGRHRVRASVAVGGATSVAEAAPPTVLTTGDSTMLGIDGFLSDELGDAATTRSDVQLGGAISRGDYWTRHARSQTKRLRQAVTVISLGAAYDAYPLRTPEGATVECCDEPWVLAYGRRVRSMMLTYLRGGRGRVFWLTPPLPRAADRQRITAAVNDAVLRAAQGLAGVTVERIDLFFSPGGYREVIPYQGRDVLVREPDGVHLNISGTAIAARLLAPAITEVLAQLRLGG